MARRFRDSEIWDKTWYRKATPIQKLFVTYLFDRCDRAGVWEVDFEMAEFFIGEKLNPENVLPEDVQVIKIDNGKKWFIPRFLTFQYPTGLNSQKPAIVSVVKLLKKHDLVNKVVELFSSDYLIIKQSLTNNCQIIKDKDKYKEEDKDKEKDKNKDKEQPKIYMFKTNQTEREDLQAISRITGDIWPELQNIPIQKPVDLHIWQAAQVIKRNKGHTISGMPFLQALDTALKNLIGQKWFVDCGGPYWLLSVTNDQYNGQQAEIRIAKYLKQGRDAPANGVKQQINFGDGNPYPIDLK